MRSLDTGAVHTNGAGLIHLKPLSRMAKFNLSGTAVTDGGVKDAKKFLPRWASVTK